MITVSECLSSILLRNAESTDHRAFAFLDDGESVGVTRTFGELAQRADAIAAHLVTCTSPGDRVLLIFEPGMSFVEAFYGCLRACATAVPVYPPRGAEDSEGLDRIATVIADCAPSAILTSSLFAPFHPLLAGCGGDESIAVFNSDGIVFGGIDSRELPDAELDTIALLQYTSGSTRSPRGVMVSHRNLIGNMVACGEFLQVDSTTRFVYWLPQYHDMGLIAGIVAPVIYGATSVLMSPLSFLQRPYRWLRAISDFGGTISSFPNFALDLSVNKTSEDERDSLDLSTWEHAFNGSEPIRWQSMKRFTEYFAPAGFKARAHRPGYGLAEATLAVSCTKYREEPTVVNLDKAQLAKGRVHVTEDTNDAQAFVGCGRALRSAAFRIVDAELLLPCGENRVGEIWVWGDYVAGGYWNRPSETEQVFGAVMADGTREQYLRTGDLGFIRDGELYVTGRIKDVLIVQGRNIYPADIEYTAEHAHPGARPGCKVAFSAADAEHVVLLQEIRPGFTAYETSARNISHAVARNHGIHLHTIGFLAPGSLPKTSSGKIQRFRCADLFRAKVFKPLHLWEQHFEFYDVSPCEQSTRPPSRDAMLDELVRRLQVLVSARTRTESKSGDSLLELGLTSLEVAQLQFRIEETFSIRLSLEDIYEHATVSALGELVASKPRLNNHSKGMSVSRSAARDRAPLSLAQQRIWEVFGRQQNASRANIGLVYCVRGNFDRDAMQRALDFVVTRHPILRSIVNVDPRGVAQLVVCDHRVTIEDARGDDIKKLMREAWERAFDFEREVPLRVFLYRRDRESFNLQFISHRLVFDAWSLNLILRELDTAYSIFQRGENPDRSAPRFTYGDYAEWERTHANDGDLCEHETYWREMIRELPHWETVNPAMDLAGRIIAAETVPLNIVEKLDAFCGRMQCGYLPVFLAALHNLWTELSGLHETTIGYSIANRVFPGADAIVGPLDNAFLFRGSQVKADEVFDKAKRDVFEAYKHRAFGLSWAAPRFLDGARRCSSPLFLVRLGFMEMPVERFESAGAKFELVGRHEGFIPFRLNVVVIRRAGSLSVETAYLPEEGDSFDGAEIPRRMIDALSALIAAFRGTVAETNPS